MRRLGGTLCRICVANAYPGPQVKPQNRKVFPAKNINFPVFSLKTMNMMDWGPIWTLGTQPYGRQGTLRATPYVCAGPEVGGLQRAVAKPFGWSILTRSHA